MRQILWTPKADEDLTIILEHLEANFGSSSAIRFSDRIDELVRTILSNPGIGAIEEKSLGIRGVVIVPYHRLFYRVKDNRVVVLGLVDGRQQKPNIPKE